MAGGPAATSGAIAFDCPDPESLARFYAELLGVDLDGAEAHALTLRHRGQHFLHKGIARVLRDPARYDIDDRR